MQPNTEDWQQPDEPAAGEHHPYTAPTTPDAGGSESEVEQQSAQAPRPGEDEAVRWQATEYIQRDKDAIWFVWFGLTTVILMLIAILLIKSITFAILIPVMAAALIVYVRRAPMVYDYTLSRQGLHINDRLHPFGDFKEFGLVTDDDQHSIMLVPRQRFMPGVTVYFPEEAGEAIVDMLAARLPMHQIKLDPIDRLIRFLRI